MSDSTKIAEPLYTGDDAGLLAASRLPREAGLATRVRTMIEAGSSDQTVDRYIEGWIISAGSSDQKALHHTLAAVHRQLN